MTNCKNCIHEESCVAWIRHGEILYDDFEYDVENCLYYASTENTVPVDEIKLHHILIDENGIPEVKLQFGERVLILRRENDPLDIVEVVHGRWEPTGDPVLDNIYGVAVCSICGYEHAGNNTNYCPNCGAKMEVGW